MADSEKFERSASYRHTVESPAEIDRWLKRYRAMKAQGASADELQKIHEKITSLYREQNELARDRRTETGKEDARPTKDDEYYKNDDAGGLDKSGARARMSNLIFQKLKDKGLPDSEAYRKKKEEKERDKDEEGTDVPADVSSRP